MSIGYSALVLGFSIEASELAAILGWGVLRGALGRTSIVENNINQTVASAVNGASAGMMFSIPALFILDSDYPGLAQFNPVLVVLACITGALLGIAFVIPLRKQMIEYNRLVFPGGVAVAAILRSPGEGTSRALLLAAAGFVSALVHLIVKLVVALPYDTLDLSELTGFHTALFLSLLTVGIGFLAGRGGLLFGLGGCICYWVLAPAIERWGDAGAKALAASGADPLRETLFVPTGLGLLIGAAIGGLLAALPLALSALKSLQAASRANSALKSSQDDELPIHVVYAGVVLAAVGLSCFAYFSSSEMNPLRSVVMAIVGLLWIWVASVIVSECLGRTNWSPLPGLTLVVMTILMFVGSGMSDRATITVAVVLGGAITIASAQAGDLMIDLKAGFLTGASPRRQQIAQLLSVWLGPILAMALIYVLHETHGLGSKALPAPQSTALAQVVGGIFGGDLPVDRYLAGAGMGLVLALSGLGGLGIYLGLGFYVPFGIVLTYSIGVLLRVGAERWRGRAWCESIGTPLAAGLIVGEALIGVGLSVARLSTGIAG